MLARKYYAQRGTSKSTMNTSAVSRSGSSYIHNLKSKRTNVVKRAPDRASSERTKKEKLVVLVPNCGESSGSAPSSNCVCSVTKPQTGKKLSSEHNDSIVAKETCNLDNYWGKLVDNKICKH